MLRASNVNLHEQQGESLARPCVLVFAGHDPSGGAGIQADIETITAQGAHALAIITALTVQDNNQVRAVYPVARHILLQQFDTLLAHIPIAAVKLGIVGSFENAVLIAECLTRLRRLMPSIPVIVDPVLGSGRGDALAIQDAVAAVQPVMQCASLITPNLPELLRLAQCEQAASLPSIEMRMHDLGQQFSCDVFLKGGHANDEEVTNRWLQWTGEQQTDLQLKTWHWPRLTGEFHGSGCTLAAAIAAQLALGETMEQALWKAQAYTQHCLENAYQIAPGQSIPLRAQQNRNVE